MKASEIKCHSIYSGGANSILRKVVSTDYSRDEDIDNVSWREWNPDRGWTVGERLTCARKSFAKWAQEEVNENGVSLECCGPPDGPVVTSNPSLLTWETGTSKTSVGISQQNKNDPYTPWYQVKVGEVLECGNRLFLAIEPEPGRDADFHPDALALLDLRSLEVFREYNVCSAFKLRRVSADITINVK